MLSISNPSCPLHAFYRKPTCPITAEFINRSFFISPIESTARLFSEKFDIPKGKKSSLTEKRFSIFWTSKTRESMASENSNAIKTSIEEINGRISSNGIGFITLNRPKALNAMNLEMDIAFTELLQNYKNDPNVKIVLINSTSPRSFCSGGDVKDMTTNKFLKSEPNSAAEKIFSIEYKLICDIHNFPKPYLCIMDGIVMGFGLGLSSHGKYKVITEKTVTAMPENAIGLFPDVGFSYLLKNKQSLGMYLGLTGVKISNPSDILFCDLANFFIPSQNISNLNQSLLDADFSCDSHATVENILKTFSESPAQNGNLQKYFASIDKCFGSKMSIFEIFETLKQEIKSNNEEISMWARDTFEILQKKCPFSLFATEKLLREVATNANFEFEEIESVMKLEYRLAVRISTRGDFSEGVRAVLIDKDQNAKWNPSKLEDVAMDEINSIFLPFENEEELKL